MHGPVIKQPDGKYKKTFFIAFIDDASRLITHAEFFYRDDTQNMINALTDMDVRNADFAGAKIGENRLV